MRVQCWCRWYHLQVSGERPWRSVATTAVLLEFWKRQTVLSNIDVSIWTGHIQIQEIRCWNSVNKKGVSTKSWLLYNCGETSVCKLWHRSHLDTSWQCCLHIGSWQSSVSIVHCEWTSLRPRWQNSDMCHFKYRVYNHRLCLKSQTHSLFTTDYTGYWLQ